MSLPARHSNGDADLIATDFTGITADLAERGFGVSDELLPPALLAALRRRLLQLIAAGVPHAARVGERQRPQRDAAIRGDDIAWLDASVNSAERDCLLCFDAIRLQLNRYLMAGLQSVEAHFAHYPPGSHYARHFDTHRAGSERAISLVLYLNNNWSESDAGALRIYPPDAPYAPIDIIPASGRLVMFLSDQVEHEVLTTARQRLSIAAWFRRCHSPLG